MKRAKRIFFLLLMAVAVITAISISASATELKTGIGIVQSSGLRLRAKPSTDADIISTASYGDNVVVIRKVDNWYLVDYNLDIGYMSADYITFKERENVELGDGKANTSAVNMRSTPSSDGELLYQLPYGDTAYIIGFNCGWYKVQYNGETGYIRSDLLELTEKPIYNSASSSYTSLTTQIINYSMNFLGTPYVWGGTTPSGFDCSGFTKYVYGNFGYSLNRTAAQQLNNGYAVTSLEVGDLVFFGNTYSSSAAATHVGIYIGNNQFIHSAAGGVKITSLSDSYYASRYVGARRIL
jgi:cell wall-associated NlpC family hydrolase